MRAIVIVLLLLAGCASTPADEEPRIVHATCAILGRAATDSGVPLLRVACLREQQ